jgi:hypothetical protein
MIAYRNSNHRNINTNYSIWNIFTIFGHGNVPMGALKKVSGQVNSPGYSKNVKDVTMGNPQPSPKRVVYLWMQFND